MTTINRVIRHYEVLLISWCLVLAQLDGLVVHGCFHCNRYLNPLLYSYNPVIFLEPLFTHVLTCQPSFLLFLPDHSPLLRTLDERVAPHPHSLSGVASTNSRSPVSTRSKPRSGFYVNFLLRHLYITSN